MSDSTGTDRGFRPSPKQIGGGLLALVALLFVVQNTGKLHVHLLWFDANAPAWLLLVVMFGLGYVCAVLMRWRSGRRRD